ncbi:MAG: FAD-binding oxidoreductase, partial [Oligoflexia bacterium]|nr:FAD-binding oxidoreductase [Oligoflexia bacterium]
MPSNRSLVTSRAPLDLDAYRRDLWPRDTLRLAHGQRSPAPALVAWPKTDDQVREALGLAEQRDLAVVPYGAGSGVCGAAAGRSNSLVVDLKAMNQVLELDPGARTVRVQAGILGQHLEDWLAPRGWMTAHSPSSIWCSTVGGYIAARGAGQFSSRYGVFDDMLLAARAETPAGSLATGAWTPKGSEDLLPVLCGSEGALGVVTQVLVRIAPLPQTRWLRGYAFPNLKSAWSAMRELMQAGLWPAVLRLYDPLDTRLNRTTRGPSRSRSHPGLVRRMRRAVSAVPALRAHLLDLPLALPGLVNAVAGQLGDDV